MEEIGIVSSIDGPHAIVMVERKSACEHCTAGTCKTAGEQVSLEAINEAGAKVGQRVRVSLRALAYVKGSLMFYGIPTVALIAGAVIGKEFVAERYLTGMSPDGASALTAFALFALSFIVVKLITRRVEKNVRYQPIVEEILDD